MSERPDIDAMAQGITERMMDHSQFLSQMINHYRHVNQQTMQWVLSRSRHGPWIDTKFHPVELRDYLSHDGLRGPDFTYGWIQGRALEALVQHARYFSAHNPALASELSTRAGTLYQALDQLYAKRNHAAFCYDRQQIPVCSDPALAGKPQVREPGIATYSDLFVVKGLIAASRFLQHADQERHLHALSSIITAIDDRRFLINESAHITQRAVDVQADDFGPRMIALGAASLLHSLGLAEHDTFSARFLDHVLTHYLHDESGLIGNTPGGTISNPGHVIELIGFHLETWGAELPLEQVQSLGELLTRTLSLSFTGHGICLSVDIAEQRIIDELCPWWSLPEAIRALALLLELTDDEGYKALWCRIHKAFFTVFWLETPPIAVQMIKTGKPVDVVPATPDLDPGYHTGLGLLTAINAAQRMLDTP